MTNRATIAIALLLCSGCADLSSEPVASPDPQSQAEASRSNGAPQPANEAAPVAPPPTVSPPTTPPPTALHVAVEGRCRHMGVSLLDGKAVVHYVGADITRLEPDGRPGETMDVWLAKKPDEPVAWRATLPQVERLVGQWPDQLYAEVMEFSREGIRGGFRRTKDEWQPLRAFGDDDSVDRLFPWYDNSLLAFSGYAGNAGAKFAVVRGKPKGPRFDQARAKTGCKEANVRQVLVLPQGDVVAEWSCEGHHAFVTHWKRDDLAGHTQDLGVDGDDRSTDRYEAQAIAFDGKDGFYVATSGQGGSPQKLWHGHDDDWKSIEFPAGADIRFTATDPAGHLWIAGRILARRDGDAWTTIALPEGPPLDELAGVEFGTPWIRRGNRVWRVHDDSTREITIPPSAFFEGETLQINRLQFAGPDDVWADAEFVVQRLGKGAPGRYYHSLLHSQPPPNPLRCGELIDGVEMRRPYAPWPTAAGGTCTQRLALLLRRKSWDDTNDYTKLRKALRNVAGLAEVRFVELELGAEKFLAASTADASVLSAVQKKAKKMRAYSFPEVVCGDAAVLEQAGAVVHRELSFAAPSP